MGVEWMLTVMMTRHHSLQPQRYRQTQSCLPRRCAPYIFFLSLNPSGLADAAGGHWLPMPHRPCHRVVWGAGQCTMLLQWHQRHRAGSGKELKEK